MAINVAGAAALSNPAMAIGAVTSGLGQSAFNAWANYQTSKKLMNHQYNLNRRAWLEQNEYNLPINQMERLSDAGLNPHLVYGNGGASATAGPISSTSQGHFSGMKADVLADLASYQNLENMKTNNFYLKSKTDNELLTTMAQNDYIRAQTDAVRERNFQLGLENGIYRAFMEDRPLTSAEKLYAGVQLGKFATGSMTDLLGMSSNSIGGQLFSSMRYR